MRLLLTLLIVFIGLQITAQHHNYDIVEREKDRYRKYMNFKKSDVGNNIDVKYHKLYWEIDPAVYYIKGYVSTKFIATQDNINQVSFDFNSNLICDSVLINWETQTFSNTNDVLTINLSNSIALNQSETVTIYYQGVPSATGFGSFIQDYHGDVPIIWTLSEPYGAKEWWPCKQDLVDKIDSIDVYVKTPVQYKVASNGVLVDEIVEGNSKTAIWKHRHPIAAYLIAIAVTNYQEYSQYVKINENDSIHVLNYFYPEDYDEFKIDAEEIIDVLKFMNEKFILYPFHDEKYGHAQFGWSGGMEHQTMSFMGNLNYYLMVHELAHQWFGDYITCGSWADIWVNEGFARYSEAIVMEEFFPENFLSWRESKINYIVTLPYGSVYCDDTTSDSRIFDKRLTYEKGGMALHMLRKEIGDEAFFTGIKNYLNDPELVNGYAKTADVQKHFEASADTNLTEYFNDWIYGQGHPIFTVEWDQNNEGIIDINIQQEQSHNSVDFFENHIEILLKGQEKDSLLRIYNSENNQEIFLNPGFNVTGFVFEPNKNIVTPEANVIGISQIEEMEQIKLIPNPAKDIIRLKNKGQLNIREIYVLSVKGDVLLHEIINGDDKEYQISISSLTPGTYFVKINGTTKNFLQKFIKKD